MKKILIVVLLLIAGSAVFMIARDFTTNDVSKLPVKAQSFINKNFSDEKVGRIEIDEDHGVIEDYEVMFKSGKKVKFDASGKWTEIDCRKANVPSNLIPEAVNTYLKANYPTLKVKSIESKYSGVVEVELSNGLELKFDSSGQLMEIDD